MTQCSARSNSREQPLGIREPAAGAVGLISGSCVRSSVASRELDPSASSSNKRGTPLSVIAVGTVHQGARPTRRRTGLAEPPGGDDISETRQTSVRKNRMSRVSFTQQRMIVGNQDVAVEQEKGELEAETRRAAVEGPVGTPSFDFE
ncbi:MAG: hypothetical protein CMJ48_09460 [Planctomycetaceae bacterium]|nr:hypothetical protein [Planctomycetaceae bacterium]